MKRDGSLCAIEIGQVEAAPNLHIRRGLKGVGGGLCVPERIYICILYIDSKDET